MVRNYNPQWYSRHVVGARVAISVKAVLLTFQKLNSNKTNNKEYEIQSNADNQMWYIISTKQLTHQAGLN